MSTLTTPPTLLEAVKRSEAVWQGDLHEMYERAGERFPDVLWERNEGDCDTKDPGAVWGHKAIVYARAPPSWLAKYFSFCFRPIGSTNELQSPSSFRGQQPSPHIGLLRLPTMNPATFPGELEYLYTARGLSQAFEFLFDKSPESRGGDEDEIRLDKLREDLVFMWTSHLYSDIRISLTFPVNQDDTTTVFFSHRFILVSRSPYFHTSLNRRGSITNGIVKEAPGSGEEVPLTVTLPSPPFTPASLHFTLGYMYTGTLIFSNEIYDLDTAFHIMRSATFLSIQPLHDEIQARIVQEMMHGLFHAFLDFSEYERTTEGKWGSGGCRCRQCARRAPRVLEFAIAEDVKNQYLERGARRALVGIYGEGWCTSEFSKLPDKIKLQLFKGLGKRTIPINIFPLLFATYRALRKLSNISDSWSDGTKELVLSARKTIDEVLCNRLDECLEEPEWIKIMAEDGNDLEELYLVMESVKRGLNDFNAPLIYQTLVGSILLKPHPVEMGKTMLSSTSPVKVHVEHTLFEILTLLRRRWTSVKQAGGFNKLDGWSLEKLSHDIDVSIDELLDHKMSEYSPHKSVLKERAVLEYLDSRSAHTTPTPAISVLSAAPRTLSTDTPTREELLNLGSRRISRFLSASSSAVSSTRSVLPISHKISTERGSAHDYSLRSPIVLADSPPASVLQKGSILLGTDPRTNPPALSPVDSASKLQSRISTTDQSTNSVRISETFSGVPSPVTQSTAREPDTLAIQQPQVQVKGLNEQTLVNYLSEIGRQLDRLNPSNDEYRGLLLELLDRRDLRLHVSDLQEPELRGFIELLDNTLNNLQVTDDLFRKVLRRLQNTCSSRKVLPSSYLIPSGEILDRREPFAAGRLAYTHEAEFNGKKICIKALRSYSLDTAGVVDKVFYEEIVVWKRLKHPNIVPFLGVPTEVPPFEIVFDWMENGRITEYVRISPQVDRIGLLWDVADGLHHLHSCEIIHGDLKGANIMIDKDGRARLTDFGLAYIVRGKSSIRVSQGPDITGMTTWAAPEILRGGAATKEGDVFTFAMVAIETFTGRVPFLMNYPAAISFLMAGKRPERPEILSHDGLWKLMETCWDQDPGKRPATLELLKSLRVLFPGERGSQNVVPSLQSAWISDTSTLGPQDPSVSNPRDVGPEPTALANRDKALIPAWRRLISRPLPINERISLVMAIFSDRNEVGEVNHLSGNDAQTLVDVIDETLDMLAPQLQRNCLDTLRKICDRQGLLPRSVQIQLSYSRSDTPLYQGGFADIWRSRYRGYHVAVKVMRVCTSDNFKKITSRFCKEVVTWKTLRHPNVLPLLGVLMGDRHFVMVSEWMEDGNINEFIKANQDVNRFELLRDIVRGLIYMHDREMIHGDLKGANILIDKSHHARLADFGLLTVISDPTYATASSSKMNSGTVPWMSPELLYPERYDLKDSQPTKESDYYALGMVIFEVLSGKPPFAGYKGFIVTRKVIEGEHPARPAGQWFTDDLWETLEQCWSPQPADRPTTEAVLKFLKQF